MRLQIPLLFFVLLLGLALSARAANELGGHPSPYLALHGEDPVAWTTWQEDVFARAQADNRLVFVSVGYFSCHWCHVMQRESYQDADIAALLNRAYVSVKVDRELDPDLDQRLIDFVEKVRGSAGWPLNVFLTPQGYPVTGFTYLPPAEFESLLQRLERQWRDNGDEIAAAAEEFFRTQMQDFENQAYIAAEIPVTNLIDAFVAQSMLAADELLGGFGNTSKFPNVPQLDTLLDIIAREPELDPDVADFVRLTLRAMHSENLRDHVNHGFFRYTTDPDWQTPHYEKMLYDNAQLAALYLKAHRLWPDQGYATVAAQTLDFVERRLKHVRGGYMSSLSAVDREDREGGAYLWTRQQLEAFLGAEDIDYLAQRGQFDAGAGEFLIGPLDGPAAGGDAERNAAILEALRRRGDAGMPADDKRLAAWNAMLLDALVTAASEDKRFVRRAETLFGDMRELFFDDAALIRFAGNAGIAEAVLEDYAQVAHAFFNYGKRFDEPAAIDLARGLIEEAHRRFLVNDRWRQKSRSLIPLAPGKWIMSDLVFFACGCGSRWKSTACRRKLRKARRPCSGAPAAKCSIHPISTAVISCCASSRPGVRNRRRRTNRDKTRPRRFYSSADLDERVSRCTASNSIRVCRCPPAFAGLPTKRSPSRCRRMVSSTLRCSCL